MQFFLSFKARRTGKTMFFNALVNFLVSENIQSKISVCFIALYLFEFVDFKGLYFFNFNQKTKKRKPKSTL